MGTFSALLALCAGNSSVTGNDIIKWEHFQRYWPFVLGIHQSLEDSHHKGQWCGALMFSLIWTWTNGCANNQHAGDLRCHHAHYDITVMTSTHWSLEQITTWACFNLTHWGRDKMAAVSQTMFSNAFSWMKIYEFWLIFHWSLFLRVQLTIFQHWFR